MFREFIFYYVDTRILFTLKSIRLGNWKFNIIVISDIVKINEDTIKTDGSKNKTQNNFWSFFSRTDQNSATMTVLDESNDSTNVDDKG